MNLVAQPVGSKTDDFLLKLVDPEGGSGPAATRDLTRQLMRCVCVSVSGLEKGELEEAAAS